MEQIISKELLSAVQKETITQIISIEDDDLFYKKENGEVVVINYYLLAHKVKEWAREYSRLKENTFILTAKLSHGFNPLRLLSGFTDDNEANYQCSIDNFTKGAYKSSRIFFANTEPEAIFKAGQWIWENIK